LQRQVDIEESRTYQAAYQYQNTVFYGRGRSRRPACGNPHHQRRNYHCRRAAKRAALEAQFLARERYDKGVTSYLEFLEQQRQAFDAELTYWKIYGPPAC
jgi:multidrug efflux system outer membrane protein